MFLAWALVAIGVSTSVYAQECKVVKIAGSKGWFPYAYTNQKGEVTGVAYELVTDILQTLQQPYTVHTNIPWKRIQQELTVGKLDILVSNHWTAEREKIWNMSTEIAQEDLHVFTLNTQIFPIENWLSLSKKRGIVTRGTALGESYQQYKQRLSILEVGTHVRAFHMLNKEHADYFLLTKSAATPYLQQIENQRVQMSETALASYSIRTSFSRRSPCALLYNAFEQKLQSKVKQGWIKARLKQHLQQAL